MLTTGIHTQAESTLPQTASPCPICTVDGAPCPKAALHWCSPATGSCNGRGATLALIPAGPRPTGTAGGGAAGPPVPEAAAAATLAACRGTAGAANAAATAAPQATGSAAAATHTAGPQRTGAGAGKARGTTRCASVPVTSQSGCRQLGYGAVCYAVTHVPTDAVAYQSNLCCEAAGAALLPCTS